MKNLKGRLFINREIGYVPCFVELNEYCFLNIHLPESVSKKIGSELPYGIDIFYDYKEKEG